MPVAKNSRLGRQMSGDVAANVIMCSVEVHGGVGAKGPTAPQQPRAQSRTPGKAWIAIDLSYGQQQQHLPTRLG